MNVSEKINGFLARLPFVKLAEKTPSEVRAKFPLLETLIPHANRIVCGLAVVVVVTGIAASGGSGSARRAERLEREIAELQGKLESLEPSDSAELENLSGEIAKLTGQLENEVTRLTGQIFPSRTETQGQNSGNSGGEATVAPDGTKERQKSADTIAETIIQTISEDDFIVTLKEDGTARIESFTVEYPLPNHSFGEHTTNNTPLQKIAITFPSTIQGIPVTEISSRTWTGALKSLDTCEKCYNFSLVFSDGIKIIEEFSGPVVSIKLPSTLTQFGGITGSLITSITLPPGLTNLPFLRDNPLLTKVPDIPDSVLINNTYSSSTFEGCNLTEFSWPAHLPAIPAGTFSGNDFTTVEIPEGVEYIGRWAFHSCEKLTTVKLPSTIKYLDIAFDDCINLTNVIIPDSVTGISLATFDAYEYKDTSSIRFTDQLWIEEFQDFHGCPKLSLASQAALKRVGWISPQ